MIKMKTAIVLVCVLAFSCNRQEGKTDVREDPVAEIVTTDVTTDAVAETVDVITDAVTETVDVVEETVPKLAEIAPASNTMYVNASAGLRIRSTPDLNAERIGVLPHLTEVVVVQEQESAVTIDWIKGKWTLVRYGGTEGWVFGGYLSAEPADRFVLINEAVLWEGIAAIKGYTGNRTEISIPPQLQDAPVRAIVPSIFENRGITSIVFPDGFWSIDDRALRNNKLTSVTFPDSVANISNDSFANNQLTRIIIPDDVNFLGDGAFRDNQLVSVTMGNRITIINGNAFRNNKLVSIVIPDNVKVIKENAFAENLITSITIGANVELRESNTDGVSSGILGRDRSFDQAYNNTGKLAGTYTRSDTKSTTWERR